MKNFNEKFNDFLEKNEEKFGNGARAVQGFLEKYSLMPENLMNNSRGRWSAKFSFKNKTYFLEIDETPSHMYGYGEQDHLCELSVVGSDGGIVRKIGTFLSLFSDGCVYDIFGRHISDPRFCDFTK
jgi:hypothetical protein